MLRIKSNELLLSLAVSIPQLESTTHASVRLELGIISCAMYLLGNYIHVSTIRIFVQNCTIHHLVQFSNHIHMCLITYTNCLILNCQLQ